MIKETIKKEISLTIDDIKDLILRDLNIEEKEGVIVRLYGVRIDSCIW